MAAPIGLSRYAELNGVRQFLGTQQMADHFNSAAYEFDTDPRRNGNGRRLVANEGYRDKPRCDLLWREYVARGYRAPKVAVRYTSNHYIGAKAVDIGIMTPQGTYAVPTPAEFQEIHEHLLNHGFFWQGQYFGEEWHHEFTRTPRKPIIPGVNQAGDPFYNNPDDKPDDEEDDEMKVKLIRYSEKPEVYAYADGSPLWWHVQQKDVDRIKARYGVDIEVVNGQTFTVLQTLAQQTALAVQEAKR